MKVLLDTNVWRYLADQDAALELARISRQNSVEILVAPAIVFETRKMQDIATRAKIMALITGSQWKRLMPEAYCECLELKSEISRLRPDWLIKNAKLTEVNRLRYDWVRRVGGFWDRTRMGINPPVSDESRRSEREHGLARQESYLLRQRVAGGAQDGSKTNLRHVAYIPDAETPGWSGRPVEYWRIPSLHFFRQELLIYESAYREWLDSEIDIGFVLADLSSLNRFWFHELDACAVPRQWLRGSFEFLQSGHRVTDGTPVDSQISTHLVEADFFVSADKNFIRFAQRCADEAPFNLAKPCQISGGEVGVKELFNLISKGLT